MANAQYSINAKNMLIFSYMYGADNVCRPPARLFLPFLVNAEPSETVSQLYLKILPHHINLAILLLKTECCQCAGS